MSKESPDQVITDPAVFVELSATQRVVNVIRASGRDHQQVDTLMGRTALIGMMVDNIVTCRWPALQDKCACHRNRLLAELAANPPLSADAPWSDAETLDLIIAVAKSPAVPPQLRDAFERMALGDPEPA